MADIDRFFWSENILWEGDLRGRQVTVSLAEKDLIVDTEAVGRYLAKDDESARTAGDWKHRTWKGEGLDILWFQGLDHAQVFDKKSNREILAKVVRDYSGQGMPQLQGFAR